MNETKPRNTTGGGQGGGYLHDEVDVRGEGLNSVEAGDE